MSRQFTKRDEAFICERCGAHVEPAGGTCRNHCPFCLTSKHVDIKPGDRANPCQGLMTAVGYELEGKRGLILHFICDKCGEKTRNKSWREDGQQPDDYDRILALKPDLP